MVQLIPWNLLTQNTKWHVKLNVGVSPGQERAATKERKAHVSDAIVVHVSVLQTETGLYYTESPELPGLVITAATVEEIFELTPHGIRALIKENLRFNGEVKVTRGRVGLSEETDDLWVAVPSYVASGAMAG